MNRFLLLALLSLLSACAEVRDAQIRKQAAFDWHCPEEKVAILEFGPLYQSVRVDVCGQRRLYHRVDSGDTPTWVAQPGIPEPAIPDPGAAQVK